MIFLSVLIMFGVKFLLKKDYCNLSSFSDFSLFQLRKSRISIRLKEIPDVHKEIRLFALPFFGAEKNHPPESSRPFTGLMNSMRNLGRRYTQ